MAATGAHFAQFEKRGATDTGAPGALVRWGGDTGCVLATSDEEMGKMGPVPSGCGANSAILRCRPRQWGRHSLRTPPRLAEFSLATPSIPIVLTGPIEK